MAKRTHVPLGRAKFHANRCNESWCPPYEWKLHRQFSASRVKNYASCICISSYCR